MWVNKYAYIYIYIYNYMYVCMPNCINVYIMK